MKAREAPYLAILEHAKVSRARIPTPDAESALSALRARHSQIRALLPK